jgi:hypothetical protein
MSVFDRYPEQTGHLADMVANDAPQETLGDPLSALSLREIVDFRKGQRTAAY